MKTLQVTLFALLLATTPVFATTKPCAPAHHHAKPAVKPTNLYDTLIESLTLSAGWRWQNDLTCPTAQSPLPRLETHDPFYIGAALSLPLAPGVHTFGAFDRDWTESPHWQARAGVAFTPFSR